MRTNPSTGQAPLAPRGARIASQTQAREGGEIPIAREVTAPRSIQDIVTSGQFNHRTVQQYCASAKRRVSVELPVTTGPQKKLTTRRVSIRVADALGDILGLTGDEIKQQLMGKYDELHNANEQDKQSFVDFVQKEIWNMFPYHGEVVRRVPCHAGGFDSQGFQVAVELSMAIRGDSEKPTHDLSESDIIEKLMPQFAGAKIKPEESFAKACAQEFLADIKEARLAQFDGTIIEKEWLPGILAKLDPARSEKANQVLSKHLIDAVITKNNSSVKDQLLRLAKLIPDFQESVQRDCAEGINAAKSAWYLRRTIEEYAKHCKKLRLSGEPIDLVLRNEAMLNRIRHYAPDRYVMSRSIDTEAKVNLLAKLISNAIESAGVPVAVEVAPRR